MTNETWIILGSIELLAILVAFFLHRWLSSIQKPHPLDSQKQIEKIQEKQQHETRNAPNATQNAPKRPATQSGGGHISFNMQDSGKPFLQDLLKGFKEYAKVHGYKFRFLIDNLRTDGVTFRFTLDPSGQNDRTSQFRQDFVDYLNMVEKRDSFDHLPVIPQDPDCLLSMVSIKNGPLYTIVSRCMLYRRQPGEFQGHLQAHPNRSGLK